MDLHLAYVLGNSGKIRARRGEEVPRWVEYLDPLETLFLGATFLGGRVLGGRVPGGAALGGRVPGGAAPLHGGGAYYGGDAYRFANACDTWLRVLRGTPYWEGIERFVWVSHAVSKELGLPFDAAELYAPLRERFEMASGNLPKLPQGLLPAEILDGARCFSGPARDLKLPRPPANVDELIDRFVAVHGTSDLFADGFSFFRNSGGKAFGGMIDGLRTLRAEGALEVGMRALGPAGLLKGLYVGLVLRGPADADSAGESPAGPPTGLPAGLPADVLKRAIGWALGLPAESSLVPVVDVLLVAVERGLETEDALGHLFSVRAFSRPVSAADREWRSSPGTALRRIAREVI
jgi:hypothetical protein